jgi:hypothetical protein
LVPSGERELDDPDPGNWRFCRAGEVTFMLGRCPEVPPAGELGDHSYLAYLQVDDVDGFYEHAVAVGADVLKAPTDEPWGMRELALRSPGRPSVHARPADQSWRVLRVFIATESLLIVDVTLETHPYAGPHRAYLPGVDAAEVELCEA